VVRIGTSGWHYDHWRGPFYPEGLPTGRMLEHYRRHFDTVELNTTFYRLPPKAGVRAWRDGVSGRFVFAAKGSRFITHMKKLKDPRPALRRYFAHTGLLGRKLGPVVFQLPPRWGLDLARFEAFLRALPPGHRYSFELRDPSWHVEEVYRLLRRRRAAFCLFDLAGFEAPDVVTADFVYVRLHGPGPGRYQGSYSDAALGEWARRIQGWTRAGRRVYVYFDNDQAAYAVRNALVLKALLGHSPVSI
jgi:uncharacterized protein YecE (DUF72 family)